MRTKRQSVVSWRHRVAIDTDASPFHSDRYHSRRASDFASWDSWEPELRMEVLNIVRRPFCAAGYLKVLTNAKGELPEMKGFCDQVDFRSYVEIKDVKAKPNGDIW